MDNKDNNEFTDMPDTGGQSFKIEFLTKEGDVISSVEETDLGPIVNDIPEEKPRTGNPYAPPAELIPARETRPAPRADAKPVEVKPAEPKPIEVKPAETKPEVFSWPEHTELSPEPKRFESKPSVYAERARAGKKLTDDTDSVPTELVKSRAERPAVVRKQRPALPESDEAVSPPPIDPGTDKNFKVDYDYEYEYQDVDEKIIKRGSGKRTGCVSGILYFIFVLCISVVLASLGWLWATDVLGLGDSKEAVEVTVPRSAIRSVEREEENDEGEKVKKTVSVADMDQIADILYENGLIEYKWLFKLYCSFSSADEKVRAGTYELSTDYDYRALIYGMNPSGGKRVEVDVTIPEGYTVRQIVELLDERGVCDSNEMWDALRNASFDYDFVSSETPRADNALEGYLFPDTYTFYMGDTASRVIGKLLSNFNKKWTAEFTERAQELGYTRAEIITVASMIEKEAGADSERATIASVIYNRLRDGASGTNFYLQIDATLYYAAAETGEPVSTDIDSPYNTYRNPGLVPGPIGNPGLASIKAALWPEDTKYYYYALAKDHTHRFFRTLDEHQAFVKSDEYGG